MVCQGSYRCARLLRRDFAPGRRHSRLGGCGRPLDNRERRFTPTELTARLLGFYQRFSPDDSSSIASLRRFVRRRDFRLGAHRSLGFALTCARNRLPMRSHLSTSALNARVTLDSHRSTTFMVAACFSASNDLQRGCFCRAMRAVTV